MALVRLKPATPLSGVKHSTTEPLRSSHICLCLQVHVIVITLTLVETIPLSPHTCIEDVSYGAVPL